MATKRSAGVLLFRSGSAGETEFLLVHPGGPYWTKRDLGAWSIPKGQIEDGEDPRDCALREVEEELGTLPPLVPDEMITLGSVRQRAGKVVEAWAGEADFDTAELASNTFALEWPPRSGREQEHLPGEDDEPVGTASIFEIGWLAVQKVVTGMIQATVAGLVVLPAAWLVMGAQRMPY